MEDSQLLTLARDEKPVGKDGLVSVSRGTVEGRSIDTCCSIRIHEAILDTIRNWCLMWFNLSLKASSEGILDRWAMHLQELITELSKCFAYLLRDPFSSDSPHLELCKHLLLLNLRKPNQHLLIL